MASDPRGVDRLSPSTPSPQSGGEGAGMPPVFEEEEKPLTSRASAGYSAPRRSPRAAIQGGAARYQVSAAAAQPRAASGQALAGVPAALRRLEQRLEAERRHSDRQLQRLERRLEEVASGSAAGGRWAELQGHVDGLAQTVQDMVRGGGPPMAAARQQGSELLGVRAAADMAAESVRRDVEGLSAQVVELAARLELAEGNLQVQTPQRAQAQAQASNRCLLESAIEGLRKDSQTLFDSVVDIGSRLARAEDALQPLQAQVKLPDEVAALAARVASAERGASHSAAEAAASAAAASAAATSASSAAASTHRGHAVRTPPWDAARGEADRELVELDEDDTDDASEAGTRELATLRVELEEQLATLRGELEDQVAEVAAQVEDLERGLQDAVQAQQVQEQARDVSERRLMLALRTQRAAFDPGAVEEGLRDVRAEVDEAREDAEELWGRVDGVEQGLEGMCEALDRVCQELSTIRAGKAGGPPAANDGDVEDEGDLDDTEGEDEGTMRPQEDEMGAQEPGATSSSAAQPHSEALPGCAAAAALAAAGADERVERGGKTSMALRHRVEELERGYNTIAEMVWDLRKRGHPAAG